MLPRACSKMGACRIINGNVPLAEERTPSAQKVLACQKEHCVGDICQGFFEFDLCQ